MDFDVSVEIPCCKYGRVAGIYSIIRHSLVKIDTMTKALGSVD